MHLINASNLHVGGGVQVATSLISELFAMKIDNGEFSVLASTEVTNNVGTPRAQEIDRIHFETLDVHGISPRNKRVRRLMRGFDSIFTVFGPLYRWRPPFRSVVGFAQPWIIYPRNECYAEFSFAQRVTTKLKFRIQSAFFKRADVLVVELEHVKAGLVREMRIAPERIHVVHNCLSSIYHDKSAWQTISLPEIDCDLRLGFVGRNYIHKNTAIFPKIVAALSKHYGIKARVYVTFTDAEWQACTAAFRQVCVNVGSLSVAQCPTFYEAMDGVVFPSLLECFSATPLEAMAMEKPLFASDRPFNKDVCEGHAHYFDPMVGETAAALIAKVFSNKEPDRAALRAARDHAKNFASPKERAEKYLEILTQAAKRID